MSVPKADSSEQLPPTVDLSLDAQGVDASGQLADTVKTNPEEGMALRHAVLDIPPKDEPRLAYANWLMFTGQGEQAEFIRLQCRLAECNTSPDHRIGQECNCETCQMRKRVAVLLIPRTAADWGEVKALESAGLTVPAQLVTGQLPYVPGGLGLQWVRGFPARVTAPTAVFLKIAEALFRRHPITHVTLIDAEQYLWTENRSTGEKHYWLNVPGKKIWVGTKGPGGTERDSNPKEFSRWIQEGISRACVVRGRKLAGLRV
ncbi:TIGR02996 domain-containing protein [Zavarzinella formosa]|uniref:TIGR02996 domain-containing protein n=1 Tax=Zavarzinella formosa TaxID=360055 RepID=UPI0002D792C5|nr:TIGR02996 domain-containing protein [Zavarzinella formosa]